MLYILLFLPYCIYSNKVGGGPCEIVPIKTENKSTANIEYNPASKSYEVTNIGQFKKAGSVIIKVKYEKRDAITITTIGKSQKYIYDTENDNIIVNIANIKQTPNKVNRRSLQVQCTEKDTGSFYTITFLIKIDYANENKARLTPEPGHGGYKAFISESPDNNYLRGNDGIIKIRIDLNNVVPTTSIIQYEDDPGNTYFNIEKDQDGLISFKSILPIDFEKTTKLLFYFVIDGGSEQMKIKFTITIQNVDDMPPAFQHSEYTSTIEPYHIDGEEIMFSRGEEEIRILAYDEDKVKERINYKITKSEHSDMFRHAMNDNDEMMLYVSTTAMGLSGTSVILQIVAYQVSNADISTSTNISIEVKQLADEVPRFFEHYLKVELVENIRENTVIAHSSVHPITGPYIVRNVHYSMRTLSSSITKSINNFRIEETTGELATTGRLDYESIQSYMIVVVASFSIIIDKINTKYDIPFTLEIKVININDNPPLFKQTYYTIDTFFQKNKAEPITTFHVSDKDNVNETFTFNIMHHREIFKITADGVLSLTDVEDISQKEYNFAIEVKDAMHPSRIGYCIVVVIFSNNKENADLNLGNSFKDMATALLIVMISIVSVANLALFGFVLKRGGISYILSDHCLGINRLLSMCSRSKNKEELELEICDIKESKKKKKRKKEQVDAVKEEEIVKQEATAWFF